MHRYKADRAERPLTWAEKASCWLSVIFSYLFVYALATQKPLDLARVGPGQGSRKLRRHCR